MIDEDVSLDVVEKTLLVDMVIKACGDKSKIVREKLGEISVKIQEFIDNSLLHKKVKDLKPVIKDNTRKSLRKIGFLKRKSIDPDSMPNKRTKRVKKSDYEKAMQILNNTQVETTKKIYLKCVLNYSEPSDNELQMIHTELQYILDGEIARTLLAYESQVFSDALENIRKENIYSGPNILTLLQLVYIRIFDTSRSIILNAAERFVDFIRQIIIEQKIDFENDKEKCIYLNVLIKLCLTINSSHPLVKFEPVLSPEDVQNQLLNLLKSSDAEVYEEELLNLFIAYLEIINRAVTLINEFTIFLDFVQERRQDQVNAIKKLTKKSRNSIVISSVSIENNQQPIQEEYDLSDVNSLYGLLNNSDSNNELIKTNIQQIFQTIFNFNKMILQYKYFSVTEENQSSLEVFDKLNLILCQIPHLLENINYQCAEDYMYQQMIFLIQIKKESNKLTEGSLYLSNIQLSQTVNTCIIALLNNNNIVLLLEILYSLFYKINKGEIKSLRDDIASNFKSVIKKGLGKILKYLNERIKEEDLVKLLDLLQNYYFLISTMKNNKDLDLVKNMLIELVKVRKGGLEKHINQMSVYRDHSFRSFIAKTLDKYDKEDYNKSQKSSKNSRSKELMGESNVFESK